MNIVEVNLIRQDVVQSIWSNSDKWSLHCHKVKNCWTLIQECDNDDTVNAVIVVQNEESVVIFKSGVNFHWCECSYLGLEGTLIEA